MSRRISPRTDLSATAVDDGGPGRLRVWMHSTLPLLPAFALWIAVFVAASGAWAGGTFYDYGWFVPPLAFAMWLRLSAGEHPEADGGAAASPPWPALWAILPCYLFFRVLGQVDPAWRQPQWWLAMLATFVLLATVSSRSGTRVFWRWVPSVAFALTAVPLPSFMESALVSHLTASVLNTTALLMNLAGIPVEVRGLRLGSAGAWVEVSDTCSGLRSLQGFLMVGLFFGEWLRLSLIGRLVLIPVSLVAVQATNVLRAAVLAWLRFQHGQDAYEAWHDTAGFLAFGVGAAATWWVARTFEPPVAAHCRRSTPPDPTPAGLPPRLPLRRIAIWLAALLVMESAAWWWTHPSAARQDERLLRLHYPRAGMPDLRRPEDFEKVRPSLHCDAGWIAALGTERGSPSVRAGWFEWNSASTGRILEVFKHSPEQCMGGAGWRFAGKAAPRVWDEGEVRLAFEVSLFDDPANRERLHVFKAVWLPESAGVDVSNGIAGIGSGERLRTLRVAAAIHRFRPAHARVLMAVVEDAADPDEAWSRLQAVLLPGLAIGNDGK